jgi:thiosulfate dehydrogenase [quinone] large subunit
MQDHIEINECAGCSCGNAKPANGIDRRQFLTITAFAAAVAALEACGVTDGTTAPTSVSTTLKVSDYAALASVGGVATTNVNGSPIAIVGTGATTFITLSRVCPHQGSTVNATTTGFRCPNHGATFDKNGTWTGGQKTSSLRSYTTAYDAATGTLTIG